MKVHKNIWLRALIGLLALTVAGMLSLYIKEAMDEKDPEASLPLITVTYDGAELPGVYRAGWSWSFF